MYEGLGLDGGDIIHQLQPLLDAGATMADVFIEQSTLTELSQQNGAIDSISTGRRFGAGIRFIQAGRQYLAHTADLSISGIRDAVTTLLPLVRSASKPAAPLATTDSNPSGPLAEPAASAQDCIALLQAASSGAEAAGSFDAIKTDISAIARQIRIVNTEGVDVHADAHRTELTVECTLARNDELDTGRRNRGVLAMPVATDPEVAFDLGRRSGLQALSRAHSRPAPTGEVDVVLAEGTAGVVFHETVGHGLEADLVESFQSVYAGRVGSAIANPALHVVDDGTVPAGWGSSPVDDEGTATQTTPLVEGGVLQGYLRDRSTVAKFGGTLTGNGRRATYADLPHVRMTNTIVSPGPTDPEDIIGDTAQGIYVTLLRGGGFNPGTGQFIFSAAEASLIENGRITAPIRNATFIGHALEVLMNADGVGNDFTLVAGGRCGKRGQTLGVGFGAPTVRLRNLTIGGRP